MHKITINKQLKVIADYVQSPEPAIEWHENIKSVKLKTSKPFQNGSKVAFETNLMKKELSYTNNVELVPGKKLIVSTSEGPFPMRTEFSFSVTIKMKLIFHIQGKRKKAA